MKKEEAIKFLKQLYPNGVGTWLDEQRMEAIGTAIEALQKKGTAEMAAWLRENLDRYDESIGLTKEEFIKEFLDYINKEL